MSDELGPVSPGSISPLLRNRRVINATLEATRSFQRTQRRPLGQMPFDEEISGGGVFAANLTEATVAASWQSRTISSGAWANDTATGTDNAYPVQCAGSAFTPNATATSIMWEEPAGSGVYAFLPIQYASLTEPGFVSVAAQSFNGLKTFQDGVQVGDGATGCTSSVSFKAAGITVPSTIRTTNDSNFDVIFGSTGGTFTLWGDAYRIIQGAVTYTGVTGNVNGLVFTGGLLTDSGSGIEFPDPFVFTVDSPSGSIDCSSGVAPGNPVSIGEGVNGSLVLETVGDGGTDPDGGVFARGLCTTKSTLSGVNTTWTVGVGDQVTIVNGRIQSITPGS